MFLPTDRFNPAHVIIFSLGCAFLLAGGPSAHADDAPNEAQALVHIHDLLTLADHDYDGHRVKAKKAVDDACAVMHLDIHGDHDNDTRQRDSDTLMHEADRELQDVRRVAEQRRQDEILAKVDQALHEVHVALHIR